MTILFTLAMILSSMPILQAFDEDGFISGMSYDEARAVVSKRVNGKVNFQDTSIIWGFGDDPTFRALSFVDGRLAIYKKELPPDFKRFVSVVKHFRDIFGKPTDAFSTPAEPLREYTRDTVSYYWKSGTTQIQVEYRPDNLAVSFYDLTLWKFK